MVNMKWGIFPAITAFILAFTTSLVLGHTYFLTAMLRATLFGSVFFALGIGAWKLISRELPDLLSPDTVKDDPVNMLFTAESPGSRINITVEDTSGAALPGSSYESHDIDNVGNIADLVTGAINPAAEAKKRDIDQIPVREYTEDVVGFSPAENSPPEVTNDTDGDISLSFDNFIPGTGIAELDAMSELFSIDTGSSSHSEQEDQSRKKSSRKDPETLDGDFNPKEIALGIRTVLEKDKG